MKSGKMKACKARRRWPEALPVMLLFLTGAHAAAQGLDAPLHVMRSATLERPLLVMSTGASAPGEVYVDDVRIRVAIEDGNRVYQTFHKGITRTLHVPLDASLRYVAFDSERNRFELLSPGLRVELEDDGLLDGPRVVMEQKTVLSRLQILLGATQGSQLALRDRLGEHEGVPSVDIEVSADQG